MGGAAGAWDKDGWHAGWGAGVKGVPAVGQLRQLAHGLDLSCFTFGFVRQELRG